MGLPARSPISDRFQGTIYMTFGCSRSPVTVAVPNSSRSILAADDFGPDPGPAGASLPTGARAAGARRTNGAGAADGAGAAADAGSVAGWFDVSARGSPASDCAVARAGFTEDGAGAGGGGADC